MGLHDRLRSAIIGMQFRHESNHFTLCSSAANGLGFYEVFSPIRPAATTRVLQPLTQSPASTKSSKPSAET